MQDVSESNVKNVSDVNEEVRTFWSGAKRQKERIVILAETNG